MFVLSANAFRIFHICVLFVYLRFGWIFLVAVVVVVVVLFLSSVRSFTWAYYSYSKNFIFRSLWIQKWIEPCQNKITTLKRNHTEKKWRQFLFSLFFSFYNWMCINICRMRVIKWAHAFVYYTYIYIWINIFFFLDHEKNFIRTT